MWHACHPDVYSLIISHTWTRACPHKHTVAEGGLKSFYLARSSCYKRQNACMQRLLGFDRHAPRVCPAHRSAPMQATEDIKHRLASGATCKPHCACLYCIKHVCNMLAPATMHSVGRATAALRGMHHGSL